MAAQWLGQFDWQLAVAGACVLVAAGYLVRRLVRLARGSSSCGGCGTCPSKGAQSESSPSRLVSITPPATPPAQDAVRR